MKLIIPLLFFFAGLAPGISSGQQKTDTVLVVKLPEVQVKENRKWTNDTARYRFNQTRHYVQTILPYLNAATALFTELDQELSHGELGRRDRRRLVSAREQAIRDNFEDQVRSLNETQGVLLVKLIARQTGVNIYAMLSEFKNPMTAVKWQTWARFHGFNINRKYDPKNEVLLEQVMLSLDYPLPDFYGTAI